MSNLWDETEIESDLEFMGWNWNWIRFGKGNLWDETEIESDLVKVNIKGRLTVLNRVLTQRFFYYIFLLLLFI